MLSSMGVFFLFLLAISIGCLSTLYWIPEDDLGRGYFVMNALIVLCLLGLATAVMVMHPFEPFGESKTLGEALMWASLAGAFLYYAAVWRERWGAGRWAVTLTLAAAVPALLMAGATLMRTDVPLPGRTPLLVLALCGSALLLGWSLITMLLGHWYLVSPRLTFRHLVVFCWALLGIVVLRLLMVGGTLLAAASVDELIEPHPWRMLATFEGEGMFFWFRLLWGLAIPLLLAVMSLQCARNRSNTSATGILYVLVVGALVGETTALYLTLTTGVPV
jgi:hypothetical protein